MRYLVVILLFLAGCRTPDTGLAEGVKVPPLPSQLSQKAGQLPPASDKTLAGQIRDNTSNIKAYNNQAYQTNALIDLYNCVKESINNKKEPKCQ